MTGGDMSSASVLHDFGDGTGQVPACRHARGGGWVADTASVSVEATVAESAAVFGQATVFGPAEIYGYAQICGNATVYGPAKIGGNVCVRGSAVISGDIRLSGVRIYEGEAAIDEEYMLGLRERPKPTPAVPVSAYAFTSNASVKVSSQGLGALFDADVAWLGFTVQRFHANGQTCLYHLTSLENLPSIVRHGLLPRNRLSEFRDVADAAVNARRRGIQFKGVGWKQAHDCVPMFFTTDTPMIHSFGLRGRQLVWVVIDVEQLVLTRAHLVFTDGNLAAVRSKAYWSAKFLNLLDWQIIRSEGFPKGASDDAIREWKRIKSAEVLAHPFVPVSAIRGILVSCDLQAEHARVAIGANSNTISVEVAPRSFP